MEGDGRCQFMSINVPDVIVCLKNIKPSGQVVRQSVALRVAHKNLSGYFPHLLPLEETTIAAQHLQTVVVRADHLPELIDREQVFS
jgi:hypothetical protein